MGERGGREGVRRGKGGLSCIVGDALLPPACLESRRSAGSSSSWVAVAAGYERGQRGHQHVRRRQGEDGPAGGGDGGDGRGRGGALLQDRPEQRRGTACSDDPAGDKRGGDIQVSNARSPKKRLMPTSLQGRSNCDGAKS